MVETMRLDKKFKERLLDRKNVPLEERVLIAEGVSSENELEECRCMLDEIQDNYHAWSGYRDTTSNVFHAKNLFDFTWDGREDRYLSKQFRLSKILEAYTDPRHQGPIANCLGLTSFYSVLADREQIRGLGLLAATHRSGNGHILNVIADEDKTWFVENTKPKGFRRMDPEHPFFRNYLNTYEAFPTHMLPGSVLGSVGYSLLSDKDYMQALGTLKVAQDIYDGKIDHINESNLLIAAYSVGDYDAVIELGRVQPADGRKRPYKQSYIIGSGFLKKKEPENALRMFFSSLNDESANHKNLNLGIAAAYSMMGRKEAAEYYHNKAKTKE